MALQIIILMLQILQIAQESENQLILQKQMALHHRDMRAIVVGGYALLSMLSVVARVVLMIMAVRAKTTA